MTTVSKHITRIRPSNKWQFINIREVIEYKDLLYFLVVRGIKARYAQSVLGVGWAVVQPLFTTLVFTIVFGGLAKISSDGVPYFLFSLTGLVPWNYFSGTLTESSNSLIQNANMISKVYFPRAVLPLSTCFSKLLDFLVGFIILVISLFIYKIPWSWEILVLPLLMIILLLTSVGIGMLLSAMAVQYRDVKHALTFLVQILMYLAPVVYPTSRIPMVYRTIYSFNPMVGVIEGFRSSLLHTTSMPWNYIWIGLTVGLSIFVAGSFYFHKMEKIFADVT